MVSVKSDQATSSKPNRDFDRMSYLDRAFELRGRLTECLGTGDEFPTVLDCLICSAYDKSSSSKLPFLRKICFPMLRKQDVDRPDGDRTQGRKVDTIGTHQSSMGQDTT